MKLWNRKRYTTGRAIILHDGKMLAFHRKRRDKQGRWMEYYSIPGGKLETDELPEHAVVRELQEEMGVAIISHGLVAHYRGKIFEHYVFSASIESGIPRFMDDSEEAQEYVSATNQYTVVWVDVKALSPDNLKFYHMFYPHITALASGKSINEVSQIPVQ